MSNSRPPPPIPTSSKVNIVGNLSYYSKDPFESPSIEDMDS
jgi:hypothetical protein